jgi:hypothetical protein
MAHPSTATHSSLPDPTASSASTLIPGGGSGYDHLPRIIKVDDSTGCTLTNASIKGLTPREFEDLSNKETDLARVIASAAEAKILGVEERGLTALLTSSVQNIKPLINKQNIAEQSIILPYIQRRQRSVMNANYFAIEAGEAVPASGNLTMSGVNSAAIAAPYEGAQTRLGTGGQGAFTGTHAANGDWCVKVNLGGSDWGTPLENIERYFLPGSYVIVNTWDSSNLPIESQFMIQGTANATDGTIAKAILTLRPTGASVPHGAWSTSGSYAGQYQPTAGVLQTIANNVNDYEAWCRNQPTDLSVRLLVNWLQTSRESREVNEQYKETLQSIMSGKVNPYLSSMVYQPLAEQNKQAAKQSQDQWTRACWYNQALNTAQKPETYMSLPSVHDPEDSGCTLEYKAQALGIKSLLREAGRIKGGNAGTPGGALDLDALFTDLYYLKRNREQDGSTVSVIDAMTDRMTSVRIFEAMNKYYSQRYGWEVHRSAQIGQKIVHNGIILFNYNIYDLPDLGCQFAVFHDPMFDDLLNVGAHFAIGGATAQNKMGLDSSSAAETVFSGSDLTAFQATNRTLWLVDWSDVKIGIAGTNSVTRDQPHPEIDKLYSCRMDSVKRTFNLRSTKWTTLLDRPHRHLIIENFSHEVTVTAGTGTGSTITV